MAWTTFYLGRPGYEYSFSAPPEEMSTDFERISSEQRNLAGDLKERVLRTFLPTVKLRSTWFPKSDLDNIASLLTVTDTFLGFKTRTDWNILLEPDIALSTTTVQIQQSSVTKLSAAYVAAGFASTITVSGVYINPDGSGTNYYTGGSYADATRTITLGSALPQVQQVYVSYSFPGWLVRMKKITAPISGGRVDLFSYDLMLEGA